MFNVMKKEKENSNFALISSANKTPIYFGLQISPRETIAQWDIKLK